MTAAAGGPGRRSHSVSARPRLWLVPVLPAASSTDLFLKREAVGLRMPLAAASSRISSCVAGPERRAGTVLL